MNLMKSLKFKKMAKFDIEQQHLKKLSLNKMKRIQLLMKLMKV